MSSFVVTLHFSPELWFFLRRTDRARPVTRILCEKTSIKDAIEACGVPHPEVNRIRCNGACVGFEHQLSESVTVEIFGCESSGPGLQERQIARFAIDGHLGKLARDLRLLGFDVEYSPIATDRELVESAAAERRSLLTRDRRLLMHKVVQHGYCPRSDDPDEQIMEVIRRFDLSGLIAPYTRCLQCNGQLRTATKAEILDQLQPLTRLYYEVFRRCAVCGKIYWSGSHFGKLEDRIAKIRARFIPPAP